MYHTVMNGSPGQSAPKSLGAAVCDPGRVSCMTGQAILAMLTNGALDIFYTMRAVPKPGEQSHATRV
jgi:hypothetical protein